MTKRTLVLHLASDAEETTRLRGLVRDDDRLAIEHVGRVAAAVERLEAGGIDVVLLDLGLPDASGQETVSRLREVGPDVPILVAAAEGNGSGLAEGVRLVRAIRFAVERHRLVARLKHAARARSRLAEVVLQELRGSLTRIREALAQTRVGVTHPGLADPKEGLDAALDECDRLGERIDRIDPEGETGDADAEDAEKWSALDEDGHGKGAAGGSATVLLLDLVDLGQPDRDDAALRRSLVDLYEAALVRLPCAPEDCLLLEAERVIAAVLPVGSADATALTMQVVDGLGSPLAPGLHVRHGAASWEADEGTDRWIERARQAMVPLDVGGSASRRILVVDDDDGFLGMMEVHLQETFPNVHVECARDGYDACIRFGASAPDLVILDVIMPGLDGGEVMRSMRRLAVEGTTKFLAISGSERALTRLQGIGCDATLLKPFDLGEFTDNVQRLLDARDVVGAVV